MNQIWHKFFHWENPLVLFGWEFFLGILMAFASFHMLPLAFEIAGLLIALSGTAIGIVLFFIGKRLFFRYWYLWLFLCPAVFIAYVFFRLPFGSYIGNGLYLGALAGVLLSFQMQELSMEKKQNQNQKSLELWYIGGLLLGILLK